MAAGQVIGSPWTPRSLPPIQRAVYVKRKWTDNWTWIPYLDCSFAEDVLPPSDSVAEFYWNFGSIKQQDRPALDVYNPLIVNDTFVALWAYNAWGQAKVWIGVIEDENVSLWGSSGAMSGFLSGKQAFTAYGLDHLLDRSYVWQSYTDDGLIDRPMIYNGKAGRGVKSQGNRTTNPNGDGIHGFSGDGATWTNKQIADVVLSKFAPRGITWALSGDLTGLTSLTDVHDIFAMTTKNALNELIPIHRGLGWKIWTTGSGTIYIYVFSTIAESVSVGSFSLPANPYQDVLRFDNRIDLDPKIKFSELTLYDEVRVQGGPLKVTGTFAVADGSLEPGWSAGEQTTYKAGSTQGSPTAKDHDKTRKSDERLRAVFQKFNVPNNFAFQLGNGVGGAGGNGVPVIDWAGLVHTDQIATIHQKEIVFMRNLGIEETNNAGYGQAQFRRAFAVILDNDGDYQLVDRIIDSDDNPEEMRVTPHDVDLSWYVEPRINHILASEADMSGAADSSIDRKYDWRNLIITAQYPTDEFLAVELANKNVPSATPRSMLILVPDAEAWLILNGTVLDIDSDGTLIRQSGNSLVRSDYQRLQFIALLAGASYGRQRGDLHVEKYGFTMANPTGTMIHSVQDIWHNTPIGTIVSRRRWDFQSAQPTSTLQTGFTELALQEFGAANVTPGANGGSVQ